VARIRATGRIKLLGRHEIPFDEPMQLLFMRHERLERHSNGMRFTALGVDGNTLREEDYFSIGGGFILRGNEAAAAPAGRLPSPYPFDSGDELLVRARTQGLELFELVMANERTWRSEQDVRAGLLRLWSVMQACVERGFRQTGLLPGVLKVRPGRRESTRRHGLGECVGARGQRRKCRRRTRGDRTDQRRGRHRARGAAFLPALRTRRQR
jgi:L-serine dehydratase